MEKTTTCTRESKHIEKYRVHNSDGFIFFCCRHQNSYSPLSETRSVRFLVLSSLMMMGKVRTALPQRHHYPTHRSRARVTSTLVGKRQEDGSIDLMDLSTAACPRSANETPRRGGVYAAVYPSAKKTTRKSWVYRHRRFKLIPGHKKQRPIFRTKVSRHSNPSPRVRTHDETDTGKSLTVIAVLRIGLTYWDSRHRCITPCCRRARKKAT